MCGESSQSDSLQTETAADVISELKTAGFIETDSKVLAKALMLLDFSALTLSELFPAN